MKLITISGLDGSGKSTQIKMLKNHLESQGKRVFYFHAIKFGLANKIVKFRNKYCLICRLLGKRDEKTGEKSVTRANTFQIFLRKLFLQIDIRRFGKLRNKLRNSGYDYILSDRYFYDSIVNIKYLSSLTFDVRKFLTSNVRQPDLAIYLQTSPEIIMQRERAPDQGLTYLQKKERLYEAKIAAWSMKTVDGNKTKEEVFGEITKLLQQ